MQRSSERRQIQHTAAARTTQDVENALRQLTDIDWLRLQSLARLRARSLPGGSGSDLLNEAIRRALDGSRPWPIGVPLIAFLAQIMRSIWSEQCRRFSFEKKFTQAATALASGAEFETRSPERVVIAARVLADIYKLFGNDAAILKVIAGLADGMTAQDIQKTTGMSETEYNTTRRRMRRILLRQGLAWE